MIESKEYEFNSLLEAVEKLIEFKEILHKQVQENRISKYSLDLQTANKKTTIKVKFE